MKIQPIVEGHGEVAAFPVLLRRLVAEAQAWGVGIGRPIRVPRGKLVQQAEVERAVRLALLQPECGAVLILFDGDRDCPAQVGPTVQAWATTHTGELPCRVVIAHREYEAWFLAAIGSLRGYRGVREFLSVQRGRWKRVCARLPAISSVSTNRHSAPDSRWQKPMPTPDRSEDWPVHLPT